MNSIMQEIGIMTSNYHRPHYYMYIISHITITNLLDELEKKQKQQKDKINTHILFKTMILITDTRNNIQSLLV